jgi:hypothetical protein
MDKDRIDITNLEPKTQLIIETNRCLYNVELIDPESGKVMITGGSTFQGPTDAFIEGACGKGEHISKCIGRKMSIIVRYKTSKQRKYRTAETEPVETVRVISPDETWSYTMWEGAS